MDALTSLETANPIITSIRALKIFTARSLLVKAISLAIISSTHPLLVKA